MAPVICYVFYVIFNNLILFLDDTWTYLISFLLCLFSFNNSNQSIMIMQSCASVVSGTALASLAVVTASVVSSELSAKANPWIPLAGAAVSVLSAKANPWIPVGRPNSRKPSNIDDTTVSASKQGVVVANYYQIQNKDDTPDNDGEKEAAQDAPGKNVPFLSSFKAYDHSVSPYPNPSSGFLPDNPDSEKPWIPVGGPNSGKLRNIDDTAVSGSKQGVVVTNYYQSLYKDDTPDEEDNVLFSSIRDNEVKSTDQNLDEGEYVTINKKQKKKKKKKKKEKRKMLKT